MKRKMAKDLFPVHKRGGGCIKFPRAAAAALLTALSFVVPASLLSCDEDSGYTFINRQFIPVGEWDDGYGGGYDITLNKLKYDSGFGDSFESYIISAVDFTRTSGILIVKLTDVTNATGDYPTNYATGKYIGVYYKDYTTSHVFIANAIDETYALIQKDSLHEALTTFNENNVGNHVSLWGNGYNAKQ